MSVPQKKIDECEALLKTMRADVEYWKRGTNYSDEPLRQASAVVLILPDNKWSAVITELPTGTKSEIQLAIKLCKPIHIAYRGVAAGRMCIYNTVREDGIIKGATGTSNNLMHIVEKHNFKKCPVVPEGCFQTPIVYGTNGHPVDDEDLSWLYHPSKNTTTSCAANTITMTKLDFLSEIQWVHCEIMAHVVVQSAIDLYKPDKRLLIQLL